MKRDGGSLPSVDRLFLRLMEGPEMIFSFCRGVSSGSVDGGAFRLDLFVQERNGRGKDGKALLCTRNERIAKMKREWMQTLF